MKKLEEALQNKKFSCPDCPFPHNLSSQAIKEIMDIIDKIADELIKKAFEAGYKKAQREYAEMED